MNSIVDTACLFFHDPSIYSFVASPALRAFDMLVIMLTTGTVAIAVCIIDRDAWLGTVSASIGAFGALVFGAGQTVDIKLWVFAIVLIIGTGGAVSFAFFAKSLLSWKKNAGPFAAFGMIGDEAKLALAPRRWPEAAGKPPASQRDVARRCFVAISAGTGGIVGNLMTLNLFWHSLFSEFGVRQFFQTLVLAVVSITLIGPFHEFILGRGLETKPASEDTEGQPHGKFLEELNSKTFGRLFLVFALYLVLDLTSGAIATCVRTGQLGAMFQIIVGGLAPAIVSYYWSAALQLGVPSVKKTATWPSVASGALLFWGSGVAFAIAVAVYFESFDSLNKQGAGAAIGTIFLMIGAGLVFCVAVGWVICGFYAWIGGYTIDRYHGQHNLAALGLALLVATVPQQAVADTAIYFISHMDKSDTSPPAAPPENPGCVPAAQRNVTGPYADAVVTIVEPQPVTITEEPEFGIFDYFNLFLGTLGWFLGLHASGFPTLVRRREG